MQKDVPGRAQNARDGRGRWCFGCRAAGPLGANVSPARLACSTPSLSSSALPSAAGIFRVPATVAAQLHDPGPVILCWILGGVIALFGALTIAELAGALPRSGGIFAYLLESFGPLPAFMFGWTELAVVRASALGATATIFAEYLDISCR